MRRAPVRSAVPTDSLGPVATASPIGAHLAQTAPTAAPIRFAASRGGERSALAFLAIWIPLQLLFSWPAPLVPAFDGPWRHDTAIFAYEGVLVRQGGMPYLTFWDHKGPLIYLINAAGLSLSGGRIWGVWALGLVAIWGASAAAYWAMRESFGVAAALAGLVFFVFALGGIDSGTNMTEQYALPLAWASALVFVRWATPRMTMCTSMRPQTHRASIAAGVVLGALGTLAFFLRANLGGAAASAMLTITLITLRQRQVGVLVRASAGAAVGATIVAVPILAWLAHRGALSAFWDQAIRYNLLYSQADWGQRGIAAFAGIWLATQAAPLLLPIAGLILCLRRLRRSTVGSGARDRSSAPVLFAVIWTFVELLLASISGRPYDHYFMMLLPPMAMLTAALVSEGMYLVPAAVRWRVRWPPMIAAVLVLVMFRPLAERFVARARAGGIVPSPVSSQTILTADYIRANSQPQEHLLVWGLAGGVYYLANRPPASRYLFASPLLTRTYGDSVAREFLGELRHTPPVLIVDATESDPSAPSLSRWDPAWRYPVLRWYAPHRATTLSLRPFYDFVQQNYTAVAVVGPERWTVYRANGTGASP